MNVYILLPVYGRKELTKKFIRSIEKSNLDYPLNIMFVIIDDEVGRYTNYAEFIDWPNVKIIKTETESWWCGTVYRGIEFLFLDSHVGDDDVVIIANNDVELLNTKLFDIVDNIDDNALIHPQTLLESGGFVSSGCRVVAWFPFITKHPLNINGNKKEPIDLCTARFLCMKYSTLKNIGNISSRLIQYHGDSEFSYRAKKKGVNSFILSDCFCILSDNEQSAINQSELLLYIKSCFSFKSSNSLLEKYKFVNHFHNAFKSIFIVLSMFLKGIIRVILKKLNKFRL